MKRQLLVSPRVLIVYDLENLDCVEIPTSAVLKDTAKYVVTQVSQDAIDNSARRLTHKA